MRDPVAFSSRVILSDSALVEYAAFRLGNDGGATPQIKLDLAKKLAIELLAKGYIDFDTSTNVYDGTTEIRAMFKFIPL